MTAEAEVMPVGVVLERYAIDHPWQSHGWRLIGVLPGAPAVRAPVVLRADGETRQVHAATLQIALYRRETEGYKRNLANDPPLVYVVLREDGEGGFGGPGDEAPPRPDIATVCPYEAQDYLDASGLDERVEAIAMPEAIRAWVQAFVDAHHVDEPFRKRKRRAWSEDVGRDRAPPRARSRGRHG